MGRETGIYEILCKRILDMVISILGLILISPIMILIAISIKVKIGGPIVFVQRRPGLNEKVFLMYKFRTMTSEQDKYGNILPDEMRLTKFGQFLRSTSLDELPELWNVIKGDMSIVGPRPLLCEYLSLYNSEQRLRHNVRPGITGLAQISGRNAISWEEKFKFDCAYVENITFLNDLKILFFTIKKVFNRENISSESHVTMEKFKGSNDL
ncbi:sugar transferase [Enterococcus rotai]|uniref:sugar transferase n=1 Tax=Enterococcus rotai TaxID=118060 RepID=UPI0032B5447C